MPTANAIAAHMRFLASDLLEGRWFQNVPLRAARVNDADSSLSINGQPLVAKKDYILRSTFASPISELSAPVVLAGFGIVAPALHSDDYAGVDARGKVVV